MDRVADPVVPPVATVVTGLLFRSVCHVLHLHSLAQIGSTTEPALQARRRAFISCACGGCSISQDNRQL
jgi:hypothetical protein